MRAGRQLLRRAHSADAASAAKTTSTARSGEQALGAARAAALPTGVACRPSLRNYDVRLPENTVDLNRGSLGDAWWVSFGDQKRVSSGEHQGVAPMIVRVVWSANHSDDSWFFCGACIGGRPSPG